MGRVREGIRRQRFLIGLWRQVKKGKADRQKGDCPRQW